MATIITQMLRRTPMLYRSRAIISNYKRTQPIKSNVSPRVLFRTFTYQNTEKLLDDNSTETSNTPTINQLKQMEDLTLDANTSLTLTLCHLLDELQIEEAINVIKSNETKVDVDQLLCSLLVVLRRFDETTPVDAFVELVCRIKERSGSNDLIGQILIETVSTNGQTIHVPILIRLLKQFCAIGTKIPITTFNQLLMHVQNNLPNGSHKTITRWLKKICDKTAETEPEPIDISRDPESMTSGELESHLIELQSKNMDCRAVLRQLLTLLVFMEKYDRAVEIHQLCKQNKVVFSPEMLFIRLNLMIRTKNLSEAEKTFNQLKRKHISVPIDESLVVDLASLMIENGQIERAKEILKFRAIGRLSGGVHCHRNVCELLLNVAALSAKNGSSVNQSEEFLQFLTKLGYCSIHNTLKGPIIREYLLKNEIGNAMTEFGKLKDETCREIPMHFELTTALIKLSNIEDGSGPISSVEAKEMLDKVTKTVASVHGKRNADVSLILAVAKVGTVAQLRKLLSEAKFNAEFLVNQSEFLDNAEATLFKVVKCSRGLSRLSKVLKEEDLYNSLLKKYIKENNVSAASALLDRMTKDKNIRLAKEFFESMAHMFRQNHFELPTELQMHLRKS